MHYLVFAAPQIGFRKLLQVPSSVRYGDLTQRPGLVMHCIALEIAAFPYENRFSDDNAPGIKLLM